MKSKKLIIALTMTIAMSLGVTAYADTESTTVIHQKAGLGMITGMRGYDYIESVLKNKLGITDDEITDGLNSGKTMYDLAKEKEMTVDQFKTALLEERNKAVDKAVADGHITSEEGDSLKETLKNNIDSCIAIPGQKAHRSEKGHRHMSGCGSKGSGNCYINRTVE